MVTAVLAPVKSSSDVDQRPLSVDEYQRMYDAGILSDDEPMELLGGVIVWRFGMEDGLVTPNPKHMVVNQIAYNLLAEAVDGFEACVFNQAPARIAADSLPHPDVMIARGSIQDYYDRHPTPKDIVLCVEVSDSTLGKDTGVKLEGYARSGVSTYLVVDLVNRRVEVWDTPSDRGTYVNHRTYQCGEEVELSLDVIGGIAIEVDDLLPPG